MNMKILIDDGLMLARGKPTGIGWYTLNLMSELPKLGVQVSGVKYSKLFCALPAGLKRLLYLGSSLRNCRRTDIDLVHYTNFYVPPRRHRAKVVSTVHDLTVFYHPETLVRNYRWYSRLAITNAVRHADLLLVPSEAVKGELLDRFKNLGDENIKVVYQDIRDLFFQAGKALLPKEHFLYVGVLEKRKGLETLIREFGRFGKKFTEAKLVLIGKPGFGFEDIARAIGQTRNVVHANYLPDDQLVAMYRRAYALIMPSLYEGFGRPVVEAMAMGLPVIASDIPTNRELFNRHGKIHLYDLAKPEELQTCLEKIFTAPPAVMDYGNLDLYRTGEVARRHVEAYSTLL
jgi:glycosyltransferase involved in cell wall biosynthesis